MVETSPTETIESSSDGQEEDQNGNEDDSEIEEPRLHYERLAYDVPDILEVESASCIAVNDKFLLIGTQIGNIHILDHQGNRTSTFNSHTASVSAISVDEKGEYMASCSDNGHVFIHGITSMENNHIFAFEEPVHFCELDPLFSSLKKHRFLVGTDKVLLYQKNWLNQYKTTTLYQGEGNVRTCTWKGHFSAFATDRSVLVYDMQKLSIICKIKKDHDPQLSADLYKCQLAWMLEDRTLLVGWADRIKVCNIVEKTTEMKRVQTSPTDHYLEITSMFTTDDIYVCGLAPCGANIAILGTEKGDNGRDATNSLLFHMLEPHNKYYTEVSSDEISLRATSQLRTDFILSCLASEQRFFIVSPREIIVARPADKDDKISYLLTKKKYEEAMNEVLENGPLLKRYTSLEVGQLYLGFLLDSQRFEDFRRLCQKIFGSQMSLWEEQVFLLTRKNQARVIADLLPCRQECKLSSDAYTLVLHEYIQIDPMGLPAKLKAWRGLYDAKTIQTSIEERLKYNIDVNLQHGVGMLLADQHRYSEALTIFLEIGAPNEVKDLLSAHFEELKTDILDKIILYMQLDYKEAALFFACNKFYGVRGITNRLKEHQKFLFEYLRCKFSKDPQSLDEGDHGQLLEYFAINDKDSLLPFLRKSNKFPLEKALMICEKHNLLREVAFLHERMGNTKKALSVIVQKLHDVEHAMVFCKEQDQDELWRDLIQLCLQRPELVTVLLQSIGNYMDPIILVREIPHGLQIPKLRDSLVKIIQDYKLQIALRLSCEKILTANRFTLLQRLFKSRSRAVVVNQEDGCEICNHQLVYRDPARMQPILIFACEHIYHDECLESVDEPKICKICKTAKKDFFDFYNG